MAEAKYATEVIFTKYVHILPLRVRYGLSFAKIWVKIDRVIMAPHCICLLYHFSTLTSWRWLKSSLMEDRHLFTLHSQYHWLQMTWQHKSQDNNCHGFDLQHKVILEQSIIHWNVNAIILMQFASLTAPKVDILTTFDSASKITVFQFHWSTKPCLPFATWPSGTVQAPEKLLIEWLGTPWLFDNTHKLRPYRGSLNVWIPTEGFRQISTLYTITPGQTGKYFALCILRCISVNKIYCIKIQISLNVVHKGPTENNWSLVWAMAWCLFMLSYNLSHWWPMHCHIGHHTSMC